MQWNNEEIHSGFDSIRLFIFVQLNRSRAFNGFERGMDTIVMKSF